MIVFVDNESKIRAVGKTSDESLKPLYIDESNPMFPFKGWSNAKICCYMVAVLDGVVIMMTPYVDSQLLDAIDMMGHETESVLPFEAIQSASMGDTEVVFDEVPEGVVTVDARDMEDNILSFHVNRSSSIVRVFFDEPLQYAADIRILVN